MKTFFSVVVLLLALLGLGYAWYWYNEGVTNAEIRSSVQGEGLITREAVTNESYEIQMRVDNRFQKTMKKLDALEAKLDTFNKQLENVDKKLDGVDKKLDNVDGKLDKILQIAERPAVDGMEVVK